MAPEVEVLTESVGVGAEEPPDGAVPVVSGEHRHHDGGQERRERVPSALSAAGIGDGGEGIEECQAQNLTALLFRGTASRPGEGSDREGRRGSLAS